MGELHHRKSYRLSGFDYSSAGVYFVTICADKHREMFGKNKAGVIELNDIGLFVQKCWVDIPIHYPNVILDDFVIMPDHVHGILQINNGDTDNDVGAQNFVPLRPQSQSKNHKFQKIIPRSLGTIVRGFKIGVTKYCRQKNLYKIWQRGFHDRIIRDEMELWIKRDYVKNNPMKHFIQTIQKPAV